MKETSDTTGRTDAVRTPRQHMLDERLRAFAQVRVTGLIAYKALIDHAVENGLQAPSSIDLGPDAVNVWLNGDASKWVESIHVDDERTRPGMGDDREIVYVTGRLPLLGFKVQLKFSRRCAPAGLRSVTT